MAVQVTSNVLPGVRADAASPTQLLTGRPTKQKTLTAMGFWIPMGPRRSRRRGAARLLTPAPTPSILKSYRQWRKRTAGSGRIPLAVPMTPSSLLVLQDAVYVLSLLTLLIALVVYLLMETQHRRQLAHDARRLILASKLVPHGDDATLEALWGRSSRLDREIIEEILMDEARSGEVISAGVLTRSLIAVGIYERWIKQLKAGRVSQRVRAALKLGYLYDLAGVQALASAAGDPSPQVQMAVALSLGRLAQARGLPGLIRLAHCPPKMIPDFTLAAALAACAHECPDQLMELLQAPQARTRMVGAWAISEVANASVLPRLLVAARDPDAEVRAKVARALGRIDVQESIDELLHMARDPIWFVRIRALDALGRLRASAGAAVALASLQDEVREVRYRAAFALRQTLGMTSQVVAEVLATGSGLSFDSMISEWDRAGYLWNLAAGLSTGDWPRFLDSRDTLQALIASGVTRVLVHLVNAYPDLKIRLRLLRLLLASADPKVRTGLAALLSRPGLDRRLAVAIKKALPDVPTAGLAGA